MTIRKKIWSIYILSVLVPALLLTGSIYMFTKSVRAHYNKEFESIEETYIKEPVDEMIESIQREIQNDSSVLTNKNYIDLLKSTVKMTPFELIIYKENKMIVSVKQKEAEKVEETNRDRIIREGSFKDDLDYEYRYKVIGRKKDPKRAFNKRFNEIIFRNGLIFLIAYAVLHLLFFRYSLRTIFAPLEKMKTAAMNIRDKKYDDILVYDGNDEVGEVFGAFEEMRLRIKESDLLQREYEENRKELIANISHDLKTPITAINGYVQGILDGVANTDDKLKSYIQTIGVYSRDMNTLIDELSLLSKLDIDGILFKFEEISMGPYIDDCIEEISFDLEEKGIEVVKYLSVGPSVKVKIDPVQIKKVLNNIIFNAVNHFDKEHSVLKISLTETDDICLVTINDNGCGIPTESLEQIFERFYRVDSSRNSETGGSGLGLSIAQRIVHSHDGEIWAESKENVGTTIAFSVKKIMEV